MRRFVVAMGLMGVAVLSSAALAASETKPAKPPELVRTVDAASVRPIRMPNTVEVKANGTVSTGGWSKGFLSRVPTTVEPADGIYDFNFEATPPSGIVNQMITPISATPLKWRPYPKGLKGVRIHAKENTVVAMLGVK